MNHCSNLSRFTSSPRAASVGTNSFSWRVQFSAVTLILFALVASAAFTAPRAAAISDGEELTRFGTVGSGSGQLSNPTGIATDLTTGHVYIAETGSNNRISVFTPWGNFVKAFGWDVAPGAVNEQQEVRVRAAGGQFKLTFGLSTTPDLAFDAPGSASEGPGSVEAALNALPSIADDGVSVSVSAVPGTPDGKTPFIYIVTFKGSFAGSDVAQLSVSDGTTPLSGGVPSTTLEARTRADGTAGGVGLESCTEESGCKAGLEGAGAGQFDLAEGIAVNASGDIFVRERDGFGQGNNRVQKFDSAGRFLLMFGGEVNKTKSTEVGTSEAERNRCTKAQLEGGDACGIGTAGAGQGQFGASNASGIALGSSGQLFVGDVERIQRFNSEGEYQGETPVSGKTAFYLAIDPISGDFYVTAGSGGVEEHVRKLDSATGAEIGQLKGTGGGQGAVATDFAGNVYMTDGGQILQYDSGGKPLSPPSCCASPAKFKEFFPIKGLQVNALGTLYVVYGLTSFDSPQHFFRSLGSAPVSFEGAPRVPPTIIAQWAGSVERTGAVLKAEINPHFWSDTRYYVEYGTGKCSEGGCDRARPVPPGAVLSSKTVDSPLQSAGIFLEGLQPGTTYHYRFVAQSSGGGPVRGLGGEIGADGEESTFATFPTPTPFKTDCPNQAFRTGFSAPLANCRAFEMVSPINKNNGDIKALLDPTSYINALNQSSTDGDRFTYSSYRAFGDSKAAPYTNQYLASRDLESGWSSEALSPAQRAKLTPTALENPYKAFSADLCHTWMVAEPELAPGATEGQLNLYRHDNCGTEGYEALIQVELTGPSTGSGPELQGVSADGGEAIFRVEAKLTEDAASGVWQTYYTSGGELRLVCILPNGSPGGGNCSGGTIGSNFSAPSEMNRLASVANAISADGSRAYWTAEMKVEGPGKIYLRLNPGEEPTASGECDEAEPDKACTLKVSETISTKAARFLGASADGSKALFEVTEGNLEGNLYMFDLETVSSTLLAGEGWGVAGASEDLSYVYFVSEEVLPETSGATAGKPNLYLEQNGAKAFIATLSKADVEAAVGGEFSNTNPTPIYHAASATPDGSRLAFISTASLTGYDNTDQATGEADREIYLYEAGTAGPVCVSCNPSGARPKGRLVKVNAATIRVATAASIPPPRFQFTNPRALSEEGSRIFFNSYDALLPRDTNGKADVYRWEAASGPSECTEKGAELYVASSGGCLSLISSGESPSDSEFLDASANGDDVFFTTNASLLPQDPGLIDVYDARVNGGFPAPPAPPGPCQGEACQLVPPPPNDPTPASASFRGAGNAVTKKAKARCAKGKARRKGRCVAKRQKQARKSNRARNANHDRRAQR
jgi:NHL repeat/WD40-like Beta Propeller Repeat